MTDVETRWSADEQRLSRLLHRAVDDAEPAGPVPTTVRPLAPMTDLGRRRRWSLVAIPAVAACLVAAVVVGIGLATREAPTPAASTPPIPPVEDPGLLYGTWDVDLSGTEVGDIGLRVRLTDQSSTVLNSECVAKLFWQAHSDGLIETAAYRTAQPGTLCFGALPLEWLESAQRFDVVSESEVRWERRDGAVAAVLSRVGDVARPQESMVAAPLPPQIRAPQRDELDGYWTDARQPGHWISFGAGGWSESPDGCNTTTGSFMLSPYGGVLRSATMSTSLVGCEDSDPAWPLPGVERLGLDGSTLVLFDAQGADLARMERAGGFDQEPLLDRVQGRWSSPTGLWLEIEGAQLTHAGNASCNTDDAVYGLSADGLVEEYESGHAAGCEPGGAPLVPRPIGRVDVDGEQLVVFDAEGAEMVRFEREQP